MTAISRLVVVLGADSAQFVDELTKADRKSKGFAETATRNAKAAGAAILAMGSTAAAGLTAIAIASARAADELAKTADKLGIATEALAGMQLAAKLTGVENNKLTMGLQRMVRRIAEAARGTGEAQGALKELGLDAERLNKLSPDQQFRAIAEQMAKIPNQADKIRLGFKLFDSEGVDLIRTLAIGATGLDEATQKAKDYGVALSRIEAKQIELAGDAITEAKFAMQGLGTQLAVAVAPAIELIVSRFNDSARSAGGFREEIQQAMLGVAQAIAAASNAGIHLNTVMDEVQVQGLKLRKALIGGEDANFLEQFFLENTAPGSFINKQVQAALEASKSSLREVEAEIAEIEGRISERLLQLVTPEQIEAQFAAITAAQKARAQAEIEALGLLGGDGDGSGGISAQDQAALDSTIQFLTAREELELQAYERRAALITANVEDETRRLELLMENDLKYFEFLRELDITKEEHALERDLREAERVQKLRDEEQRIADQRLKIEEKLQKEIAAMRERSKQLAIGLLQSLAGESRKWAIAAIALEKGLAIAEVIINTHVGAARAVAQAGIYAAPFVAAIYAQGAIQVGLIAATGLVQAASVGSGGARLGSSANPVFTDSSQQAGSSFQDNPAQEPIIIVISGGRGLLAPFTPEELIDSIRDTVDNNDMLLIGENSRQMSDIEERVKAAIRG